MKSVNKVTLVGNLGKDPELKSTPQGTSLAKMTLATTDRFKGNDGQWQDRTEWHNIILWASLTDIAGQYLKKGAKIYIEGRLQTRSYEKDGQKKYITEIVGNDLVMLDGKSSASEQTTTDPSDPPF